MGFLDLSTSMTLHGLEPKKVGVLVNFLRFRPAMHIFRGNCTKMAGDRPRQPAREIFSIKCRLQQSKS